MMNDLVELLHRDNHTLVVANGEICTFHGRGISDLYRLFREDPGFLKGASVADKVVGKGAAALMILGGVEELYADIVSEPALFLLKTAPIRVCYKEKVSQIQNRTQTDYCPVEKLCRDAKTAEECFPLIKGFINSIYSKYEEK